jgi:hypothetical protein
MIDYWPILDTMAVYGHFINNMIIVYIAFYFNANFVMLFNLICVASMYMIGTIKLDR